MHLLSVALPLPQRCWQTNSTPRPSIRYSGLAPAEDVPDVLDIKKPVWNQKVNPKQLADILFQQILNGKKLFLSLDIDGHLFPYHDDTVLLKKDNENVIKAVLPHYEQRVKTFLALANALYERQGFISVAFNTARSVEQVERLFLHNLKDHPIAIASENGGVIKSFYMDEQPIDIANDQAKEHLKALYDLFRKNLDCFLGTKHEFTETRLSLFNANFDAIDKLKALAAEIDPKGEYLTVKELEHIVQVGPKNFSKDTGMDNLLDLTGASDQPDLLVVHSGDGRGDIKAFNFLHGLPNQKYPDAEGLSIFVGADRNDVTTHYILHNNRDGIDPKNRNKRYKISLENTKHVWETLELLLQKIKKLKNPWYFSTHEN